jgi:uncharacterized protein YegL
VGDRLGGVLARRPLHFIWLLDVSGSMAADGKIQALNVAVRESIPHILDASRSSPGVELLVRVATFSSSVRWVVPTPTPVEQFGASWRDVGAEPGGLTELGMALDELARQMRPLAEDGRGYAPAIVLVSDGEPTNTSEPSFRVGLERLLAEPWGAKSVRRAVAIGRDANLGVLRDFIGHPEIAPLAAHNPDQLAQAIRFVSTVAVAAASRPTPSSSAEGPTPPVSVPAPGPDQIVW